jgi:hypothetical protein
VMFSSGYPQQRYPLLTRPLDIGAYVMACPANRRDLIAFMRPSTPTAVA